jgi:hypothetical protein
MALITIRWLITISERHIVEPGISLKFSISVPPIRCEENFEYRSDEFGGTPYCCSPSGCCHCFEFWSCTMGQHTEPGALAPSKHLFDNNLTALALGAASEGCIEETLSTLRLAAEVDEAAGKMDDLDDVSSLLADKTRKIALEEGRHSALAWRTIRWVCSIDEAACDTAKREVLNPSHLTGVGRNRFASRDDDEIEKAWTRIHETLLPIVTMGVDPSVVEPGQALMMVDCAIDSAGEVDEAGGLTWMLVNNIIRGVQCGDGTVRSAVE